MRVLIVSPLFPDPVNSGGATRIRNLVAEVGAHCDVHMIALTQPEQRGLHGELPGLAQHAALIEGKVNHGGAARFKDALAPAQWWRTVRRTCDRMRGYPRMATRSFFPKLESCIRDALDSEIYDIVQLEFTEMGRYVPVIRKAAPHAKIVLEEIDISYLALERLIQAQPEVARAHALDDELARLRPFERRLWNEVDAVVTMSDVDRDHIRASPLGHDRVFTVANGVDTDYFAFHGPADAPRLFFMGYFRHPPNATGLRFFLDKAWPAIRTAVPDACLEVVGAAAPDDIAERNGAEGITIHGFVDDVRPLMAQCRATIVPVLHGGGTRLKVLEAFSSGIAVVSTAQGCEGIPVCAGKTALLAESGEEMAAAVEKVLLDTALVKQLAHEARALVERDFTWSAIGATLKEGWDHVLNC